MRNTEECIIEITYSYKKESDSFTITVTPHCPNSSVVFTEHHTVKEMSETAATGPEPNQEQCASKACRIPASTGDRIFLIILLVDGRTTAMCCCSSQL